MKNGCIQLDDTDLYYAAFGRGEKKLVVLPGLSDGLATVKGKALFLSVPYRKYLKEYTVYMFSRKNHMPAGYTMEEMAEDQIRIMKMLGIEKAFVLGVSQGGMIAQHMAISHPEMVEKLILAVTSPYANAIIRGNITLWMNLARKRDHAMLMADTAEKMYSEAYLKKYRKLLPLIAGFSKPKNYERFFRNGEAILGFDVREELSKIHCPAYIIAGNEDHTVGNEAACELHDGISGSRLFIYEGLGHGAYEEAKDFYERIFTFCKG